jgi:hypothetical protein
MSPRDTGEVFEDHLALTTAGEHDRDIAYNYADDVVLLTGLGIFRGHEGVRQSRATLGMDLPDARFSYVTTLVDREYAFLEWRGESEHTLVDDGADGFVIRDGLIRAQTIHYTVRHRMGSRTPLQHARSRHLAVSREGVGS